MNAKVLQSYHLLAQRAGLQMDPVGGGLYGQYGGYQLAIYAPNLSYPYMLAVTVSVSRSAGPLSKEECRQFKREVKPVANLSQNGYGVTMTLKNAAQPVKLQANTMAALEAFVRFLRNQGFQNCCQTCGQPVPTDTCFAGGGYLQMCPSCYASMQQNHAMGQSQLRSRSENVVGGIVGALIGSLLGVACIVILSQMGYVAALSGVVMAVATLKGYEMLSGKLTRKGLVISILLMLVMTYVGDRLDWAILISQELDVGLMPAFRSVPYMLELGAIEAASYWGNMVLIYLFLLVGAIPTIINTVRGRKLAGRIYRLEKPAQQTQQTQPVPEPVSIPQGPEIP